MTASPQIVEQALRLEGMASADMAACWLVCAEVRSKAADVASASCWLLSFCCSVTSIWLAAVLAAVMLFCTAP